MSVKAPRKTLLFATKSVDKLRADAEHAHGLKRTLSALDLVGLGIGGIIGTGIFVLTGHAAAAHAGPAVVLSFVLSGLASAFAGLCYAEMASMIPIAGSAYTYAYATMGELVAWIIGWDLVLEYLVGAATVAAGWSGYVRTFLHDFLAVQLPQAWSAAPIMWQHGQFVASGSIIDLPAVLIALLATTVLVIGIKESARVNAIIVFVKVAVVLLFIVAAAPFIRPENWHPFVPPNEGTFGRFGMSGIFQGATVVFFAYIGFDAVSTAAQETRNPQRDLPIGILGSLAICTVLYILVSAILTGVVSYTQLSVPHPIAVGIAVTGKAWLKLIIQIGAIAGLSSVMLVLLLGQSRVFFSMAHDGLLPRVVARIHPRLGTPHITTIVIGLACALAGGTVPISELGELTSIGTLFAFVLVSIGVMILRVKRPEIPRKFKVPFGPYVIPSLGALSSGFLMYTANTQTILRLFIWMALGLVIYAFYGRKRSFLRASLATTSAKDASPPPP